MTEGWSILSVVIFLPLVGVGFLFIIRGDPEDVARNARWTALWTSLITFGLSLFIWFGFERGSAKFQFVDHAEWLPDYGIAYHVGVDGISMPFVLLTTLLTPICVIASWDAIKVRVKEYMIAFLALETLMVGMFCALDMVVFYIFFEGVLIPMFLIIGVWGGPRRVYAAFKFFLYTLAGSVLMLLAILAIYFQTSTTDIPTLLVTHLPVALQPWLWLAFFASFAVKVPMWPVHTWLPDAHVEAPTAGSVILAGILLKMGGYGFLRFSLPMMPDASAFFTPLVFFLSVIAVIYTSLVALAQEDMKKLIAYSSVAHMGFVTAGSFSLTQQGLEGAPHAHPDDRRLRRLGGAHAVLRSGVHGLHAGLGRAAGDQRLRGRVPGAGRAVPGQHLGRSLVRQRHGAGRRLHALPLPAGHLRHHVDRQAEDHPGHVVARARGLRALAGGGVLDGRLSHVLHRRHVGLDREPDRQPSGRPGGNGIRGARLPGVLLVRTVRGEAAP
jgi:hypothetical protein